MKKLALAAAAMLATTAVPAWAAPIVLFNTGVGTDGALLADGATDPHYSTSGKVAGGPYVYSNGAYLTATDAKFISILPGGDYLRPTNTYSISFTLLPGAGASISGFFAADDGATVSLNGGPVGATTSDAFHTLTAFSFTSGFVGGVNTLNFTVLDSGTKPSALIVSGLSGNSVPEPATWAMMLLGFGMVGFGLRASRKGKVTTKVAYA